MELRSLTPPAKRRSGSLRRRFRHMVSGEVAPPRGGMAFFVLLILVSLVWSVSAATHQKPVQTAEKIEWQSVGDAPTSGAATP